MKNWLSLDLFITKAWMSCFCQVEFKGNFFTVILAFLQPEVVFDWELVNIVFDGKSFLAMTSFVNNNLLISFDYYLVGLGGLEFGFWVFAHLLYPLLGLFPLWIDFSFQ